jgi:hypothetical protein
MAEPLFVGPDFIRRRIFNPPAGRQYDRRCLHMHKSVFLILLSSAILSAQVGPVISGQFTALPSPLIVAPGQIVTLLVSGTASVPTQIVSAPAGAALPTSLAGISVDIWQATG